MSFAFAPAAPTTLPIIDSKQQFPIRRVYCVGRNYAAHTREMGGNPEREPPCFFTKPADAIVAEGGPIDYPPKTRNLHHEVELVVAIGKQGSKIAKESALDYVFGYAVGIDLTRRDLQSAAKKSGMPWDSSKAFDQSAPCSAIVTAEHIGHPKSAAIRLDVNGKLRQEANIADMIWSVGEIVAELSTLFTLKAGDLIFTGTPEGVDAVAQDDVINCCIDGVGTLTVTLQ